ncbi:MAG TPA: M13 family metallopeptidase [Candidatus Xenobia bacterium]
MRFKVSTLVVGAALLASLSGVSGAAPGAQSDTAGTASAPGGGFDPANLDRQVKPGVNFYMFAVGGWKAHHTIPAELPEWGSFAQLAESNRDKLHGILDEAAKDDTAPAGSNTRKLGDYYKSGMDDSAINAAGLTPLQDELTAIDGIASLADLEKVVARLHRQQIPVYFGFGSEQDATNSNMMLAEVAQDGLGLPDRDYYTKTDERSKKVQDAYRQHVARMFVLAGDTAEQAAAHADTVYAYEKRLAAASRTNVALRDPVKNFNRLKLADLQRLAPDFPWTAYFADTGCPPETPVDISQPEFVQTLQKVWAAPSYDDARLYLKWHLLHRMAPYLSDGFVDEDFSFTGKVLRGTEANMPRWKRVVRTIDATMGEALGQSYVARYFPPSAKAHAVRMVHNIKEALREDLATLPWMSPATRKKALAKIDAFQEKIGYPSKWRDYGRLEIGAGPYVTNVMAARQFNFDFDIAKINKPVDRTQWDMSPPTVNAYYNPNMNEIVFPAGILQPPFFDPHRDDAYNYGGIGAVIGHEMTHGFDDQGALYDAQGNLKNWWTKADKAHFDQRTVRIRKEYSSFEAQPGLFEKGDLESGEAIADLGGCTLALRAYEKSLAGKPHTVDANGFTPEQRFFLGFAQIWESNVRPQYERLLVNTDPHPLDRFRVNGTLSNMPTFAQAWHLKPGDPMVLPADKRTEIW